MSDRWLLANRAFFVRDLVRDYCAVYRLLAAQRRRFERDGAASYAALRELLGEAMRKGVFWRLKDTAHHLFRNPLTACRQSKSPAPHAETGHNQSCSQGQNTSPDLHLHLQHEGITLWQYAGAACPDGMVVQQPVEALIDWCIGYAFHECAKLKEDAFQGQHYASRLIQLSRHPAVSGDLYDPLAALADQTAESSLRELSRILHVLSHGLFLLTRYLAVEGDNPHLARWLACEEAQAREVFGPLYAALLQALYGPEAGRLYWLAAQDFLESGRRGPARTLLHRAHARGLLDQEGQALLRQLEQHGPACADGADDADGPYPADDAQDMLCAACENLPGPLCLPEPEPTA